MIPAIHPKIGKNLDVAEPILKMNNQPKTD
jgi:hypothetical protein